MSDSPVSDEGPPPTAAPQRKPVLRWAGAALAGNAVVALLEVLVHGVAPSLPYLVASAVIDGYLGWNLWRGDGRYVRWAIARMVLGIGLVAGIVLGTGAPRWLLGWSLVPTAALLLLLGGGLVRRGLGAAIFAAYAILEVAVVGDHLAPHDALTVAEGRIDPEPVQVLTGVMVPYQLRTPGEGWYRLRDKAAKANNPLVDRWLVRPDRDVHLFIIVEKTPGQKVLPELLGEAMMANARQSSAAFEVVERQPLAGFGDDGQRMRVRYLLRDAQFEAIFAAISTPGLAFQITAAAPRGTFEEVQGDLEAMIASFTLPAAVARVAPGADLAPIAGQRLDGVAAPYVLSLPGDRWFVRKDEVVQQEQPGVDRWLVRVGDDTHVVIRVNRIKPGVDAVMMADTLRKELVVKPETFVLSTKPLGADPKAGQLLRVQVRDRRAELYVAVLVQGDLAVKVVLSAPSIAFPRLEAELKGIAEGVTWAPPR